MSTSPRRPRSRFLALLIGVLVAAWWPEAGANVEVLTPAPGIAATGVAAPDIVAGSASAHDAGSRLMQRLTPVRSPAAYATGPVHARHWSWRRGLSRRTGRDADIGVCVSAMPAHRPAVLSSVTRDRDGTGYERSRRTRLTLALAASPRAPPSLT